MVIKYTKEQFYEALKKAEEEQQALLAKAKEIEWKTIPRINPIDSSWICPYCGKKVYSMEVHPCNQPYCGGTYGERS